MSVLAIGSTIGILGGGQLGKMTALAAAQMGYRVIIFTDRKQDPASLVSSKTIVADYTDKKALEKFASLVDRVTFEFENIPASAVAFLEGLVPVTPGSKVLEVVQNRIKEKAFIQDLGIAVASFEKVTSAAGLKKAFAALKQPKAILKISEQGYDGKGQHIIDKNSDHTRVWKEINTKEAILEAFIPYEKEISVIVARHEDGSAAPYMPSENLHKNGILDTSIAPAELEEGLIDVIWEIAFTIADALKLVGVLAVEFFLTKDKKLLVNELAPRPHNSGHWTIDACTTSQFEQLVRIMCGWPLGSTEYHAKALMKNLIGNDIKNWEEFIDDADAKVHIYGKDAIKEGRKMGHVTLLLSPDDDIIEG